MGVKSGFMVTSLDFKGKFTLARRGHGAGVRSIGSPSDHCARAELTSYNSGPPSGTSHSQVASRKPFLLTHAKALNYMGFLYVGAWVIYTKIWKTEQVFLN